MPPPDQAGEEAEAEDGEEGQLIQSYLNVAYQQPQESDTATVLVTNPDEENPNGVTYFVDEHGRYYYQPNTEEQTIMSITTPVNTTNVLQEGLTAGNILEDGYQTVTLVPSESDSGEVSYVLVVQEEKPVINLDIKIDQDEMQEQVQNLDRDLEQELEQELELAQEQAEADAEQEQEQEQEQEIGNDDVYTFEEENIEEVSEEEEVGRRKRVNKRRNQRTKFTCTFCHYTSHRRYLLLRHMKTHSEDRPYKCKVCDRGFKTMASLQNHVNMHNGVKPHVCQFCKSPFTTSGELVRHVRYRHTHEKPHKCSECDYASVELSKLRRHVRCHTGERPYQCPDCTYASPDTFKLKRHIRTHTGEKPYKCDSCNMCFTQSNSLKAHRLIHNVAEKPVYRCELCPAKCGRKTDLRIHIQKLHTSDKPQKCKRCGKSFPDRYSCKVHNKTHEGEKCFKCDLCPYASTMLRHLKSHMLKHTDEKPFACTDCDQSFRQKQLLRRHHNLYHNPDYVPKPAKEKTHACHDCKRIFAHKGNLIRHLAIHDPDSGHNEHALALRLGRQRKVKFSKPSVPDQEGSRYELKFVAGASTPAFVNIPVEEMPSTSTGHRRPMAKASRPALQIRHGRLLSVSDTDDESVQLADAKQEQRSKWEVNSDNEQAEEEERTEDGDLVKMGLTNTELRRGELVTVADGDGQQYVVLEVIQLEDGTEQHVAVVAPEYIECEDDQAEEQVEEEEQTEEMEEEPQEMRVRDSVLEKSIKLEKDVNTCFGFDEDGDEGEDEDYEMIEARN